MTDRRHEEKVGRPCRACPFSGADSVCCLTSMTVVDQLTKSTDNRPTAHLNRQKPFCQKHNAKPIINPSNPSQKEFKNDCRLMAERPATQYLTSGTQKVHHHNGYRDATFKNRRCVVAQYSPVPHFSTRREPVGEMAAFNCPMTPLGET